MEQIDVCGWEEGKKSQVVGCMAMTAPLHVAYHRIPCPPVVFVRRNRRKTGDFGYLSGLMPRPMSGLSPAPFGR